MSVPVAAPAAHASGTPGVQESREPQRVQAAPVAPPRWPADWRPPRIALGVTGTDTGVGKTVVAAALAAAFTAALEGQPGRVRGPGEAGAARASGGNGGSAGARTPVGVLKPAETGVPDGSVPPDAALLRAAAGGAVPLGDVCPFVFTEPVAPLVAAERAGRVIPLHALDAAYVRVAGGRAAVIVEGAGGLLVPVADGVGYDTLFARWGLAVVIVAANRLGVLNHAALTVRAAEAAGLRVAAVVLNTITAAPPDVAESTNLAALRRLLPRHKVLTFPSVGDPHHIPALAEAAVASGLLHALFQPPAS